MKLIDGRGYRSDDFDKKYLWNLELKVKGATEEEARKVLSLLGEKIAITAKDEQ